MGCIPSKAMLESSELYKLAKSQFVQHGITAGDVQLDLSKMLGRKDQIVSSLVKGIDGLFRKNKITRYLGKGKLTGPGRVQVQGTETIDLEAKSIILATGSVSAPLRGVELQGDLIGTSTEALSYPAVPEHLVVIGAGVIGLELGCVWARLAAKVTVLEYLPRILPGMDSEIVTEAQKILQKQG